jgi:hypothetical protein
LPSGPGSVCVVSAILRLVVSTCRGWAFFTCSPMPVGLSETGTVKSLLDTVVHDEGCRNRLYFLRASMPSPHAAVVIAFRDRRVLVVGGESGTGQALASALLCDRAATRGGRQGRSARRGPRPQWRFRMAASARDHCCLGGTQVAVSGSGELSPDRGHHGPGAVQRVSFRPA